MIPKEPADRLFSAIAILLSTVLIVLAVIRAIVIPLTHDEAFSLSAYVGKPIFDIIGYVDTYGMPNNHILNTLLMKGSSALFGNSTFGLRLPNLLALVIYLNYSFRLLYTLQYKWLRPAALLLLCLNPYLFDFFSLARGYGLANGLLVMAIYLFFKWWETPSNKKALGIFLTSALAVLSDFSTIHFFFAITMIFSFLIVKQNKPKSIAGFFRCIVIPLVASVALAGILFEPFRCIIKWKTTFGGSTGFWHDCVLPLVNASAYQSNYSEKFMHILPSTIMVLCVLLAGVSIFQIIKKRRSYGVILFSILFMTIFTTQLQHLILGSEFPVARTIQFIYPLFILSLIFSLDNFAQIKRIGLVFTGILGVLLLSHFCNMANIESASEWKFDASNRRVLTDLKKFEGKGTIRLGITWIFEPGLNYELKYQKISWISPVARKGITDEYDFYYVMDTDTAQLTKRGKKIIGYYPKSNSFLLK